MRRILVNISLISGDRERRAGFPTRVGGKRAHRSSGERAVGSWARGETTETRATAVVVTIL